MISLLQSSLNDFLLNVDDIVIIFVHFFLLSKHVLIEKSQKLLSLLVFVVMVTVVSEIIIAFSGMNISLIEY